MKGHTQHITPPPLPPSSPFLPLTSSPPLPAYGYGFLMVLLVSLGSLLGIVVVPLISNGNGSSHNRGNSLTRKALVYKYTYFFMIALGTSALICDAVLHLFPHVSLTSSCNDHYWIVCVQVCMCLCVHVYLCFFFTNLHVGVGTTCSWGRGRDGSGGGGFTRP